MQRSKVIAIFFLIPLMSSVFAQPARRAGTAKKSEPTSATTNCPAAPSATCRICDRLTSFSSSLTLCPIPSPLPSDLKAATAVTKQYDQIITFTGEFKNYATEIRQSGVLSCLSGVELEAFTNFMARVSNCDPHNHFIEETMSILSPSFERVDNEIARQLRAPTNTSAESLRLLQNRILNPRPTEGEPKVEGSETAN